MTTTAQPNMTVALLEAALEYIPKNEGPGPRSCALMAIELAYERYRLQTDQINYNNFTMAKTLVRNTQVGKPLTAKEFVMQAIGHARRLGVATFQEEDRKRGKGVKRKKT
jgi:hypothetical protein